MAESASSEDYDTAGKPPSVYFHAHSLCHSASHLRLGVTIKLDFSVHTYFHQNTRRSREDKGRASARHLRKKTRTCRSLLLGSIMYMRFYDNHLLHVMSVKSPLGIIARQYFKGFRIDGIIFSLLSGSFIGIGWQTLKMNNKILQWKNADSPEEPEEGKDYLQNILTSGIGTAFITFGIYVWVPPFIREYYICEPNNASEMLTRFAVGWAYAFFAGSILGVSYFLTKNDQKKFHFRRRIMQTSIGCGALFSGLFLVSPDFLKKCWIE
jgi:hypothetical protein